jgi:hypothetical protein
MAKRDWTPRQDRPQPPESITASARRYHACLLAFAHTTGIPPLEVLRDHYTAVTAIYIETSRQGVRLPAGVKLAPLQAEADIRIGISGQGRAVEPDPGITVSSEPGANGDASPPTMVPPGWPCAGQRIDALKPAQLSMLVGKVVQHLHSHQDETRWIPLLHALQAERASRLERGRQRPVATAEEGATDGR